MKAAWFDRFGEASAVIQIGDQPTPRPSAGEVLIRLHASGVNPSDVKKRAGSSPGLLMDGLVIPHSDGAGIIEAVGVGVTGDRIGERVWVYNGQFGRQHGTAAEYISLPSTQAIPLPSSAGFDVGACMGIPAMTAHRCVTADGSVEGQTILVTGGAGRVGHYAIQWGKMLGATVIATASTEAGQGECRQAGADLVVGHPSTDSVEEILEFSSGRKIDRVVESEFGANLNAVLSMIKTSGTIATYSSMIEPNPQLPFYNMMFMDLTLRTVLVYVMPKRAKGDAASAISNALGDGSLKHRIAKQLPLERCAEGHAVVEAGELAGCTVLTID